MKQDEIIKLARDAGFLIDGNSWIHAGAVLVDGRKSIDEHLKRFANLVAAHKAEVALAEAYRCGHEAGAVAEREACAEFFESTLPNALPNQSMLHYAELLAGIATAIRARGNT